MPLALAKALILKPALLLLDEPTNYIDLETSIWLCSWLKEHKHSCILLVKSNDEEFLSGLCDSFIDLRSKKVKQYDGTYEDYAKSKEVSLLEKAPSFVFATPEIIQPPFLQLAAVNCKCPHRDQLIFEEINFDINQNSRIALIGAKGAGKTTLLKILAGDAKLTVEGSICRSPYLRIGHFYGLLIDKLDPDQSVMDYVNKECTQEKRNQVPEFWLSTKMRSKQISELTHDQKIALVFACLAAQEPHLLLIDDPTNNMDLETIESLAMALKQWTGAFLLASNNVQFINAVTCDVWVCGSKGLEENAGDIMAFTQQIKQHNADIKKLEDPTETRDVYPQFAAKDIISHSRVVHPSVLYEEYIDSFKDSYKPNCISLADYSKNTDLVSTAPSMGLKNGDMQIPGESSQATYRLITGPGQLIGKTLLEGLHQSVAIGECFSDFDASHVYVRPDGTAVLKEVRRQNINNIQLRRNHMAIHKIISDFCSKGGAVPVDVGHLLHMIAEEPQKSGRYHVHSAWVPVSQTGPMFMRMQEHVVRDLTDDVLREKILMAIPYVENGEWHALFQSNDILKCTYIRGQYTLPPLQAPVTPQQERARQVDEADNFLLCLRNRVKHRLDYLTLVARYTAHGSDLATHARFSLVNCVLQDELEEANETKGLKLHEFL